MKMWIGSEANRARAHEHDAARTAKIREEPNGQTWQCPRCGNPLDLVAEHAFSELWECAQCGYSKQVKQ